MSPRLHVREVLLVQKTQILYCDLRGEREQFRRHGGRRWMSEIKVQQEMNSCREHVIVECIKGRPRATLSLVQYELPLFNPPRAPLICILALALSLFALTS